MAYRDMEDTEIMKKFALVVFVILALMCAVSSVFAGGPPMLCIGCPPGQTTDWGQDSVPATRWGVAQWDEYVTPYPNLSIWVDKAKPMIMLNGQGYYDIGTHVQPATVDVQIVVPSADIRTRIPLTVDLLDKYHEGVWSPQHLSMWDPSGALIADTQIGVNGHLEFWLDNPASHPGWGNNTYTMQFASVPEPSSLAGLLSMMTGSLGLGALIERRRRA